ncbi:unnamed protein product [Closterium sp. NIES-64]|nr:unnamed protein product [Closterium sp. NIES-64]
MATSRQGVVAHAMILLVALSIAGSLAPASASTWTHMWNQTVESPLRRFLKQVKASPPTTSAVSPSACTSVRAPFYPAAMPRMRSSWYLQRFLNLQRIQIKSSTWGSWWNPTNGGRANSVIGLSRGQPSVRVVFRVVVAGPNKIKLLTNANAYVGVANMAGYPSPALVTTMNAKSPSTVFQVSRSGVHWFLYSAYAKAYVGANGQGKLMAWSKTPDAFQRFRIIETKEVPAIRGVNLGSWLVYENWMDPYVFPASTNYLDGSKVAFQNRITRKYITNMGTQVQCNKDDYGDLETFRIQTLAPNNQTYALLSPYKLYMNLGKGFTTPTAESMKVTPDTLWTILVNPSDSNQIVIRAPNGYYLEGNSDGSLTATGSPDLVNLGDSATFGTSLAFNIKIIKTIKYDWQLAYQLQGAKTRRIENIRSTFITEADWQYMRSQGINTVRIPVPYYIYQPRPDFPFVPGMGKYVDWAMRMGTKYGIRVFLSMHMVAGTQSGTFGSRLGYAEFAKAGNKAKTLQAVRWIAKRYGSNPAWMGMGLMNEPSLDVPLPMLKTYYTQGYNIIRQYSPCAYVSIEGQYGPYDIMSTINEPNTFVESHFYDVFQSKNFASASEEIAWLQMQRTQDITSYQKFGRPLLIGEFSNAMKYTKPTAAEQQLFSLAQMQTYAQATAGWFFWSLKIKKSNTFHWDFKASTERGWLPKKPSGYWY